MNNYLVVDSIYWKLLKVLILVYLIEQLFVYISWFNIYKNCYKGTISTANYDIYISISISPIYTHIHTHTQHQFINIWCIFFHNSGKDKKGWTEQHKKQQQPKQQIYNNKTEGYSSLRSYFKVWAVAGKTRESSSLYRQTSIKKLDSQIDVQLQKN